MFGREVTRFAPSPTGYLHLGHVVSALHASRVAGAQGQCILRIEDHDAARCRTAYVKAIIDDLRWVGMTFAPPILRQSEHLARYHAALHRLKHKRLLYPCYCSRADVRRDSQKTTPTGEPRYSGRCRKTPRVHQRAQAWRLDMARALDVLGGVPNWEEQGYGSITGLAAQFGDLIIGRRDTGLSYNLCVVCDDALQQVTCVTRGADLFEFTSVQRVLQCLLGFPAPTYAHHQLIYRQSGGKLSKSLGATALRDYRERGVSAARVIERVHMALEARGRASNAIPEVSF